MNRIFDAKWCTYCQRVHGSARLVRVVDQGTGPGMSVYACRSCRTVFRLVPLDEADEGAENDESDESMHGEE